MNMLLCLLCMAVLLLATTADAEKLFHGVLDRKVKADTARNALTVLQRYRFLFNLPRSIERNIRNVCLFVCLCA